MSFIEEKVLRLFVPAIFFYFILNPLCINLVHGKEYAASLGFYNLWFVMALFIFSVSYSLARRCFAVQVKEISFPKTKTILLFIIGMGIFNFLTRLLFKIDRMYFFDFTLGYFPQYIILFPLGIIAYRNKWLNAIDEKTTRVFFILSCVAVVSLPVIFFGAEAMHRDIGKFYGGFNLESCIYSVWEPCMYVGIILKIVQFFKMNADFSNSFLQRISRYGYAVFIFHSPIIVLLQLWLSKIDVNILWKVLVVIPATYVLSLGVSHLLLKIPKIDRLL